MLDFGFCRSLISKDLQLLQEVGRNLTLTEAHLPIYNVGRWILYTTVLFHRGPRRGHDRCWHIAKQSIPLHGTITINTSVVFHTREE